MKIKAACACGKTFLARAELAGRRVKCPVCGQALTIPDLQPAAEDPFAGILDEIGPLDASSESTNGVLTPARMRRSASGGKWIVLGVAGVGVAGLVLVGAIVVALAGRSVRKGSDAVQVPDTTTGAPSEADADGWYTYTSTPGQCSISMPQKPKEEGQYGVRAVAKMPRGHCILEVYELPKEVRDVEAELDERMDKRIDSLRGEIKESRSISLEGHRGRDFTYEATLKGGRRRGRCQQYIVGGLSYEILFTAAWDEYSEAHEKRFFDSFTLLAPEKARPRMAGSVSRASPAQAAAKSGLPDALPSETARVSLPDSLHGRAIAFSARGDRLLVGCFEGAVVLYDTNTWEPLPTKGLIDPKTGKQSSANFSRPGVKLCGVALSPDGRRALCWGEDPVVQEWDLQSGQSLHEFRHEAVVTHAVYSPDGRLVVTAPLYDTTLNTVTAAKKAGTYPQSMKEAWRIWDVETGKELRRCAPPIGLPRDLRFSPDGERLYLLGSRCVACVEPGSGDDIWRFPWLERGVRLALALDPKDERTILYVDERLSICDLTTGKISHRLDDQPKLELMTLAATISPDGRWAALGNTAVGRAAGELGQLQFWDLERRVLARELSIPSVLGSFTVAFHPNGSNWLFVDAKQLRVFDLPGRDDVVTDPTNVEPDAPPDQPSQAGQVRKVLEFDARDKGLAIPAFSPDGDWIARGGAMGIAVFDTSDGQPFRIRPFEGHRVPVLSLAVSGDGKTLISTDNEGAIFLWDPATGSQLASFESRQGAVSCSSLSLDGKLALTTDGRSASEPYDLILWDVATAQPLRRLQGHKHPVLATEFLDEHRAVSVDMYTAALWDIETGKLSAWVTVGEAGQNAVRGAAFSADGTRLLTCSGRHARLWDLTNGKMTAEIASKRGSTTTASLSHNGRLGAFWDDDVLILHDFQTGRDLDRIPTDYSSPIVSFSRDDRRFSVHRPSSFTLWAVPELEPSVPTSPSQN